jgi:hypothetical protein
MKIGVSVKIDVTKIDKDRLFKGEKGTYLDLTTFIDTENKDQYGNNGFISQSLTKEERHAGAPHTPILGNVTVFYNDHTSNEQRGQQYEQGMAQAKQAAQPAAQEFFDEGDNIPFANPYKGFEYMV